MHCYKLAKKAFLYGTGLAVILLISSKLVLACQSVVCNNGTKSDICSIEANEITTQWYFNFALAVFIAVSIIYFARKRKGLFAVISCSLTAFLPPFFRYLRGDESCDFLATKIAKWLFYVSLLFLIYQITSWILQLKKFNIKLP